MVFKKMLYHYSHQEKAEHVCVLLFLFGAKEDLKSSFYRALARKNLSVKACRLCQLP